MPANTEPTAPVDLKCDHCGGPPVPTQFDVWFGTVRVTVWDDQTMTIPIPPEHQTGPRVVVTHNCTVCDYGTPTELFAGKKQT